MKEVTSRSVNEGSQGEWGNTGSLLLKEEKFWSLSVEDIFKKLKSSNQGLTNNEAFERQKEQKNIIKEESNRYVFDIILSQFKSPLILVLIVASIIAYILGEKIDAYVILAIILLSSVVGFYQEYRAEKTVRELKKYLTNKARVLRNDQIIEIDSKAIVIGDIIYLIRGDIVPADIRLIKTKGFVTNESILTGESIPVLKNINIITNLNPSPSDLKNMALMGTAVENGSAHGIVTAIGKNTFFGKIAEFLEEETPKSEFQKDIKEFGNFLLKVMLVITFFIFAVNAFMHKGILDSLLFALAIAVGITPEILPVITMVSLAKGSREMAKQKVIIKKLASVEDLGNIDILCCDKTGTLTEGAIELYKAINLEEKADNNILLHSLLCNAIRSKRTGKLDENFIDRAIWESHLSYKLKQQVDSYNILDEEEFDFKKRKMSILLKHNSTNLAIIKGAPEYILNSCKNKTREIEKTIAKYENEGYIVIALASKITKEIKLNQESEKNYKLTGLLLFLDPPKRTIKDALLRFEREGIKIKIISGDSPIITNKVCEEVGLKAVERVITGDELNLANEIEFESYCLNYNIFARITPEQKGRIVNCLAKMGHTVGFLGDGVNDTPALKAATVGISVDSAAGVAKESADVILLKKSLHVLGDGIIEGRKTFSNIMKYILNTISANYGNMVTVALSSLFLKFIPLLPSQILLNNFLSDIPQLTVSTDLVDRGMLKKPKKWNIKLISRFMIYFGLISSIFDFILIFILIYILKSPENIFRTAWFLESVLSEIFITFVIRTNISIFKSKPSKWLLISSIIVSIFSISIIFTTIGQNLFKFTNLTPQLLLLIFGIIATYMLVIELVKKQFFKRFEI